MQDFIFRSTGAVISLLEKVVKARFEVDGLENIPDSPCLFVANHFTRAETFILPYILYKYKQKKVRSLADDQVFVGALGKYLRSVGTISTALPDRNKVILKDLIVGDSDWLIYPEGVMVKNKNITLGNKVSLDLLYKQKSIHTGAAVLALKAELLKGHYLSLDHNKKYAELNAFKKEHLLTQSDHVNPKPLHIVPVSISYFPLRPGDHTLLTMIKKFTKDLPDRILEELEIEGNLLFNSEISMSFGEPINVCNFIANQNRILHKVPRLNTRFKVNLLVKLNRHRLINESMHKVYNGVTINFDHIFSAILAHYPKKNITRSVLKKLIFLIAKDIKELGKYRIHRYLDSDLPEIFFMNEIKCFDSILELAISQNVLAIEGDSFLINKKRLLTADEFHKIRLTNCLKVFLNEISVFRDVINLVVKNVGQLDLAHIKERVFQGLVKSDQSEYYDDYQKYFNKDESKERYQGEPFYLKGKDGYPGIVLSHGYKASPFEVNDLAIFMNNLGYHIYAVRLKGHGTSPVNLKSTEWEDWYASYLNGYAILKQKCNHIIAAGFSTGGLLALLMAAEKNEKIQAVISVNAALKINDIKVNLVPGVHFWNELLDLFNTQKGKKEFVVDVPENPHINYAKNYLKGVYELTRLMDKCGNKLKCVTAPALIIQGNNDPVVNPKSSDIIFKEIASNSKEIYKPERDNHVIILGEGRDQIFVKISQFLEKLDICP